MDNGSSPANWILALVSGVWGFFVSPEQLQLVGVIVMPIVVLVLGKLIDIAYKEWKEARKARLERTGLRTRR